MRWSPWQLAGAWVLAAVVGGVVLWNDAHFVGEAEGTVFSPVRLVRRSFGCSRSRLTVVGRALAVESGAERILELRTEEIDEPYSGAGASLVRGSSWGWMGSADEVEARLLPYREAFERVQSAGALLFVVVCAAPFLGLGVLLARRAHSILRRTLMVVALLAPLAALEWFGLVVDVKETGFPEIVDEWPVRATAATWLARVAWGGLAAVVALSWWRPTRTRTVAPEVFE